LCVIAANGDEIMMEPQRPAEPLQAPVPKGPRLTIGLAATVVVLLLAGLYLWIRADRPLTAGEPAPGTVLELLLRLSVADVGQFVSGVAALLALVWFVLVYLQQSGQLRLQREELVLQRGELVRQREETKRLANQAREQLEVLRQTASVARREAFIRLLDLYERRLVLEASQISSMTAIDRLASENHQSAWRQYEQGDRNALFEILTRQLVRGEHREFLRRVDQVAGGRAFLERFSATAAEVLKEAALVDEQMVTLCRHSQWAYLAKLLDQARTGPSQPS
jgi:hypothetical protein